MRKLNKPLLVFFVLALVTSVAIVSTRAQINGIEAEILPSSGTANTNILIRFLTTNGSIGNVEKADIFWDDVAIGLNESGNQSADGSYNYYLKIPTEPPLSDVGNHTIRADSLVLNYGQVSFNFTFRITEFVPSPEYIALNTTYYSVLTNYTDLLNRYTSLSVNYSTLLADYSTLLSEHNDLLSNFNSLSANYNSLLADYNALSANYNSLLIIYTNLHSQYSLFLANYSKIVENQNLLSSSYSTLREDYSSLESSYRGLRTNYDSIVGEHITTRNISYIFIASTIIFAATTVYLVFNKQRPPSKTR